MLVIYDLGALLTAILDGILNISKRSMMPEWHQLDSSSTMPQQQESIKKKTLKSSSRSFWFSTGLKAKLIILLRRAVTQKVVLVLRYRDQFVVSLGKI